MWRGRNSQAAALDRTVPWVVITTYTRIYKMITFKEKQKINHIAPICVDCRRSLTLNDHFSGNAFKTRRKNSKCCKNSRRKNFFFGTSELSNPGWNHSEWPDIRHQTYAGLAHASDLQRSNAATGREIAAAEKRIGNQNFLCGI